MKDRQYNIENQFAKFLSGNMTSEESEEFNLWIESSPENHKLLRENKKLWDVSGNYFSPEQIGKDKESVLQKVQSKQTIQLNRARRKLLFYKVAAILAIPITFALSWYFITSNSNKETLAPEMFCEIAAPKGNVAKCILPDGSEVWINAGSTISYNTSVFNQQIREVQLSGEAYFEVAKNKEIPFQVSTSIANILVTGTSFNVKAHPGSNEFETILAEGGIEMELKNKTHQKLLLQPGERAVYNSAQLNIVVEKVDADYFTSWRNGELLFKDATLNDLVNELERIYDIKFNLQNQELGEFRFRGMFSYNNDLIEALEKIKRTAQIDYYIENKEVWLIKKSAN
ncbi:FecR domain-containing protein [uncultured Draconibacterium sp.]|uniref:FecR family protein n=1 Tax=uncultured Draconibacterium sp. TaxID=1573823 RepID=UPI003217AB1A